MRLLTYSSYTHSWIQASCVKEFEICLPDRQPTSFSLRYLGSWSPGWKKKTGNWFHDNTYENPDSELTFSFSQKKNTGFWSLKTHWEVDLYLYSEESEKSQNISREYLHLNDVKFRTWLRKFSLFFISNDCILYISYRHCRYMYTHIHDPPISCNRLYNYCK